MTVTNYADIDDDEDDDGIAGPRAGGDPPASVN